jgi:hypothetical protein
VCERESESVGERERRIQYCSALKDRSKIMLSLPKLLILMMAIGEEIIKNGHGNKTAVMVAARIKWRWR